MEARMATIALAAGRIAIGTAAFVAPRAVMRGWIGAAANDRGTQIAVRGLAVRDVALGLGTLAALDDPGRTKNWIEAGIIADAGDFTATAMGGREARGRASLGVMAIAGGAAAAGMWLRGQLTTDAPSEIHHDH